MLSLVAENGSFLINKAGRITLACAVLTSAPIYYMKHLCIHQYTCYKIDQITRNFIWKNGDGVCLYLVRWDRIGRPKANGGLGIRQTRHANVALLGKLIDTFSNVKALPPWAVIMAKLYACGNLLFPRLPNALCLPIEQFSSGSFHYAGLQVSHR